MKYTWIGKQLQGDTCFFNAFVLLIMWTDIG